MGSGFAAPPSSFLRSALSSSTCLRASASAFSAAASCVWHFLSSATCFLSSCSIFWRPAFSCSTSLCCAASVCFAVSISFWNFVSFVFIFSSATLARSFAAFSSFSVGAPAALVLVPLLGGPSHICASASASIFTYFWLSALSFWFSASSTLPAPSFFSFAISCSFCFSSFCTSARSPWAFLSAIFAFSCSLRAFSRSLRRSASAFFSLSSSACTFFSSAPAAFLSASISFCFAVI